MRPKWPKREAIKRKMHKDGLLSNCLGLVREEVLQSLCLVVSYLEDWGLFLG
jgi:hypothetical protein